MFIKRPKNKKGKTIQFDSSKTEKEKEKKKKKKFEKI